MHLKTSKKRASAISSALMLILLAINSFTGYWYPYIYITIGAPLAFRQFLSGRIYDMVVSLSIFGGLFLISSYDIDWSIILPVVFLTSALMILFREFLNPYAIKEPEMEENTIIETIEEKEKSFKD
jgi:hypothetical protein